MSVELTWNGAAIQEAVERALVLGIDRTTSDAAIEAKRLVNVDTSTLQGSIYPEPAKIIDDRVEGAYGPHDVDYAIWQEFALGQQTPEYASTASGKTYSEGPRQRSGGKPYMRPSAANAEKALPGNIAAAYRGLS
jgi:hypothetical protein